MSETSALNGRVVEGAVTVREMGLQGMVTVRGNLASTKLKKALTGLTGGSFPKQREIAANGDKALCWMSPDELLLLVPHGEAGTAVATIDAAMAGQHYMAVNVSDARAMFEVKGPGAREVMARLCPVDFHPDRFAPGEMRRSRMAQIPAAFWMPEEDCFRVICFRSVAEYAFGLLANAAKSPAAGVF